MEQEDKHRIEKIIADRKNANHYLSDHSLTYKKFAELENITFRDGVISKKNKELIALGISIEINCESCMEWHIKQAIDSGATKAEIIETIDIAIEMGGGPATVAARFAIKILEFYNIR
jgi:AhpD family alkylhydroperoxidase